MELNYLLILFAIIFIIGCIGITIKRTNCILTLLSIELMYLGIIFSFLILARIQNSTYPYVWSLVILIVAACESAIGLGIIVTIYKRNKNINFSHYRSLHG